MKKVFLFLLALSFAPPAFAISIRRDTPTWLPVIFVSGDSTSRPVRGVTGTWSPAFTISYAETTTPLATWNNLAPSTSNFVEKGGGLYFVNFTASQVGPGPGPFYYFASIDAVTAPFYGVADLLSISADTWASQDNLVKISVDTNGVALRWSDIKSPTATVDLSATTIFSADGVGLVDGVRRVVSNDSVTVVLQPIGRVLSTDRTDIVGFVASADSVKVVLQSVGRVLSLDAVTVLLNPVSRVLSADSVDIVTDSVGRVLSVDAVTVLLNPVSRVLSNDSVTVVLQPVGRVLSVDQTQRVISTEDVRHVQSADSVRVLLDPNVAVTGTVSVDNPAVAAAVWGRVSSDFGAVAQPARAPPGR